MGWTVPDAMKKVVDEASAERDLKKAAVLWRKYQEGMVDAANLFVLIQPTYQIAVRKSVLGSTRRQRAGWPSLARRSRRDREFQTA